MFFQGFGIYIDVPQSRRRETLRKQPLYEKLRKFYVAMADESMNDVVLSVPRKPAGSGSDRSGNRNDSSMSKTSSSRGS